MIDLDHFDLALLDVLQRFGRATHQQLGEQVPLSPSQIGRRLQRLESTGIIDGYRVVLRPEKLGLTVTAFTSLKLKHHGDSIIEQFQQQIEVLPEVLECHATVGDADYLLRIVAPDLNALSSFVMKKLMRVPGVDSVRSNIVLTTFNLDDRAAAAIRLGASGFLLKDATPAMLLDAIRTVYAGNAVLAPRDLAALLDGNFRASDPPAEFETLTDKERDVFAAVARGLSNAEIAAALHVSETTVKSHVGRILAKLGLRDRVQVAVYAYEHGVVRPGHGTPPADR